MTTDKTTFVKLSVPIPHPASRMISQLIYRDHPVPEGEGHFQLVRLLEGTVCAAVPIAKRGEALPGDGSDEAIRLAIERDLAVDDQDIAMLGIVAEEDNDLTTSALTWYALGGPLGDMDVSLLRAAGYVPDDPNNDPENPAAGDRGLARAACERRIIGDRLGVVLE